VQEETQNSVKGAHLGPSNEGERARDARYSSCVHPSPTLSHSAREVGVLKRHGVNENESEFGGRFHFFCQDCG
jgi:hypothetical protein